MKVLQLAADDHSVVFFEDPLDETMVCIMIILDNPFISIEPTSVSKEVLIEFLEQLNAKS